MEIGAVSPVAATSQADRLAAQRDAAAAAQQAKAQAQQVTPRTPVDAGPKIRPTLQDKIDFTRALLTLRTL